MGEGRQMEVNTVGLVGLGRCGGCGMERRRTRGRRRTWSSRRRRGVWYSIEVDGRLLGLWRISKHWSLPYRSHHFH